MNVLMILTAFRDMLPGGTDIDFDAAGLPILPGGFVAILAAGGIVVTLTNIHCESAGRKNARNGNVSQERE